MSPPRSNPTPGARHPGGTSGGPMPAHARLIDAIQGVIGGVALRDDEWAVVLHGRMVAATESAGLAIAMLRHTASLLVGAGRPVRVDIADSLRERAAVEGAAAGKSLDDYLAYLEAERAELARERREGPSGTA